MLDELAFVQAMAADPDDDGPRLLYADYLDERGDESSMARAEFIRVQCALAQQSQPSTLVQQLAQKESALLMAYWRTWLRPICHALGEASPVAGTGRSANNPMSERYSLHWLDTLMPRHLISQPWSGRETAHFYSGQFRRGMLSHVALVAKLYRGPQHIARLIERTPLDGLTLIQYPHRELLAAVIASNPVQLRALELVFADGDGVSSVISLPDLQGLRYLMLRSIRFGADVGAILAASHWKQLQRLSLNSCDVDTHSLLQLCRLPWFQQLRHLELIHCGLTDSHARLLMEHWPARPGQVVDLSNNRFSEQGWRLLYRHFENSLVSSITERPWPERYYE